MFSKWLINVDWAYNPLIRSPFTNISNIPPGHPRYPPPHFSSLEARFPRGPKFLCQVAGIAPSESDFVAVQSFDATSWSCILVLRNHVSSENNLLKFAGKVSWSLTSRVHLSMYIYLDPPFGYQISGLRKVCFFGVFFGAHISHPTEGFRVIHPPAFERESIFLGGRYIPIPSVYGMCTYMYHTLPLKTNHFM